MKYNDLQADRPAGSKIAITKAREILKAVFTRIMPKYNFAVRDEQISLAEHILNIIERHCVTLAEAEVGIGKTLAYIIVAILVKRGRINDFHNMGIYPEMQYSEMSKMPVVVATSSIALQQAILTEYIPKISKILTESGVIEKPITAALRKGKDNYICLSNLKTYMSTVSNQEERQTLENLLKSKRFDFAKLGDIELSPKTRGAISVDGKCFKTCSNRKTCRYCEYREKSKSPDIDIYILNQNMLLADTLHRSKNQPPLIPNYQLLIIDEAHKFLSAARQMYGIAISSESTVDIHKEVINLHFKRDELQSPARRWAKKLNKQSKMLFKLLSDNFKNDDSDENDSSDFIGKGIEINANTEQHLRNICKISTELMAILQSEMLYAKALELVSWVSRKYKADVSGIELGKLIPPITVSENERKKQVNTLYKTICELDEIRRRAVTQKKQKGVSFRFDDVEWTPGVYSSIRKKLQKLLNPETTTGLKSERLIRIIWQVTQFRDKAAELLNNNNLICWYATQNDEQKLCAIPKDLGKRLYNDQWSKQIPTILTSGTLSAAGNFTHIKNALGLNHLDNRFLSETTHPSPFNYRKNALLYISENVPFPDQKSSDYINAVADETEKLILASHGHAAVLFTSYKVMDLVWEKLKNKLSFPLFRLDKSGTQEIERFKQSGGAGTSCAGVLFASGSMWEGIDIPGDALSMLIIVKLPFQIPDPVSEYDRRAAGCNFQLYLNSMLIPEMLVKLKQGFGRLIRTEEDTGCVAILDSRANDMGNYRGKVLAALPDCKVTSEIEVVSDFFVEKKPMDYFSI